MTPAEKKRLIWTLIAIFFFFANLIMVAVILFNGLPGRSTSPAEPAVPATATSQP